MSWFMSWFMSCMSWFKPLKSTKQMWGWGGGWGRGWGLGQGVGARAQTQTFMSPILTHTHPLNPFTHGPKHSHTPIPTPPSPMAKTHTFILTHFTHGPQYTDTHPLNPSMGFSHHGQDTNTHPPISPMAPNTYTHPSPKPFDLWAQILSHTHSHTPFTHDPDTYT